jgi:hypothetical protein
MSNNYNYKNRVEQNSNQRNNIESLLKLKEKHLQQLKSIDLKKYSFPNE